MHKVIKLARYLNQDEVSIKVKFQNVQEVPMVTHKATTTTVVFRNSVVGAPEIVLFFAMH